MGDFSVSLWNLMEEIEKMARGLDWPCQTTAKFFIVKIGMVHARSIKVALDFILKSPSQAPDAPPDLPVLWVPLVTCRGQKEPYGTRRRKSYGFTEGDVFVGDPQRFESRSVPYSNTGFQYTSLDNLPKLGNMLRGLDWTPSGRAESQIRHLIQEDYAFAHLHTGTEWNAPTEQEPGPFPSRQEVLVPR